MGVACLTNNYGQGWSAVESLDWFAMSTGLLGSVLALTLDRILPPGVTLEPDKPLSHIGPYLWEFGHLWDPAPRVHRIAVFGFPIAMWPSLFFAAYSFSWICFETDFATTKSVWPTETWMLVTGICLMSAILSSTYGVATCSIRRVQLPAGKSPDRFRAEA